MRLILLILALWGFAVSHEPAQWYGRQADPAHQPPIEVCPDAADKSCYETPPPPPCNERYQDCRHGDILDLLSIWPGNGWQGPPPTRDGK